MRISRTGNVDIIFVRGKYKNDMPIFEITADALVPVAETTFAIQGITERRDLQRILLSNIGTVAPDCFVLAEEYGKWDDSKRRIDILCLDTDANLVVVELKRTEDAGHGELQAVRYAAMIHLMTFEDAVNAHANFSDKSTDEARQAILEFLPETFAEEDFASDVRIVLVSAEFSKEVTSTAIWLTKKDVDLRCVRMKPYVWGNKVLVDIQQILPLPEAADYQVQLTKKKAEERQHKALNIDFTKYDLTVNGQAYQQLTKRKLFFSVVQALVQDGVKIEQIVDFLPKGMWLWVDGECDHDEFSAKVAELKTMFGKVYNLKRYYTQDDELFHVDGKTYAVTNQIGISSLSKLDDLMKKYPANGIAYSKSVGEQPKECGRDPI